MPSEVTDAEIAEILANWGEPGPVYRLARALQEARAQVSEANQIALLPETMRALQAAAGPDSDIKHEDLVKLRATVLHFAHLVVRQDNDLRSELSAATHSLSLARRECEARQARMEADAKYLNWLDHHSPRDPSVVTHEIGSFGWFPWGRARLEEELPSGGLRWKKITAREAIAAAIAESESDTDAGMSTNELAELLPKIARPAKENV